MTNEVGSVHLGRNIKRLREVLHIKQENLGFELARLTNEEWSQQRVSLLENREDIEVGLLEKVAKSLNVTPEAIRQFNEDAAIQVFSNTFNDNATNNANYRCTINDVHGILQLAEDYKRLYEAIIKEKDERIRLYEQLYKANKE